MITCFLHYDILAKARCRMTMAITFSLQNYVGSHVRTTSYWEILVLVLKGLYHVLYHVYWQHTAYEISGWQRGFPWCVIGPKWTASGVIGHSRMMRDLLFFTVNSVPNSVVSLTSPPHTVIGWFPFCQTNQKPVELSRENGIISRPPSFPSQYALRFYCFPAVISHQSGFGEEVARSILIF